MRHLTLSLGAMLATMSLAIAGNMLLNTVLPLRARHAGFTDLEIGIAGSAYFAGMLAGAFLTPVVVRRLGYVAGLGGVIAVAAVSAVLLGLIVEPLAWVVLRCVVGCMIGSVFSITEGWMHGSATSETRGRLIGIYGLVQFSAGSVGALLLHLTEPRDFRGFLTVALIGACGLLPLLSVRHDPPARPLSRSLDLGSLARTAPVAMGGALMVGLANGSFFTFIAIALKAIGLGAGQIGTFMMLAQLSSGLSQVPIGRLSDRGDRRRLLVVITAAAAALELTLAMTMARLGPLGLYAVAVPVGALMSTPYFVISAHANDRMGSGSSIAISSSLLLMYSIGAICGPLIAAEAMAAFGDMALLAVMASAHAALSTFTAWRIARRGPPDPLA